MKLADEKVMNSVRAFELPHCDTLLSYRVWFGMMFYIHRRLRSFVSSPRAWTIRGGWLGTKQSMLEPDGEFYTGFCLYSLGDGYTKINIGSQVSIHRMKSVRQRG